jgi:hypothetical protein
LPCPTNLRSKKYVEVVTLENEMGGEREDLKFDAREFRSQGSVKRAGRESEGDSESRNVYLIFFS